MKSSFFALFTFLAVAASSLAQSRDPVAAEDLYAHTVAIYKQDRNVHQARSALANVLKLDSKHTNARFQLAMLAKAEEKWLEAANWFEEIAQLQPNSPLGRKAAGEAKALRLTHAYAQSEEGKSITAYRILVAEARVALKEKRYSVAGAKFSEAIELIPLAWEPYVLCSSALIGLERFEDARNMLKLALDRVPEDKKPAIQQALERAESEYEFSRLFASAATALSGKKFAEAAKLYSQAWDRMPNRRIAGTQLLQCHVLGKNFAAAIQVIGRLKTSGAAEEGATTNEELDALAADILRMSQLRPSSAIASSGGSGKPAKKAAPSKPKSAADEVLSRIKALR